MPDDLASLPAHATRLRVRYCECDPMGVAHHASYAPWMEQGRTELLRERGMDYASMEASGILLVVVQLEVAYRRPVRYDDVIEVRTRVVGTSRVKIEHAYEVCVVEQSAHGPAGEQRAGVVCAVGRTVLACVTRGGKVREVPAELRA